MQGNRGPGDGPRNTTEINRDVIDRLQPLPLLLLLLLLLFHSPPLSARGTKLMHCQSGERAKSRIAHIVISVISISDDEPSIFHCWYLCIVRTNPSFLPSLPSLSFSYIVRWCNVPTEVEINEIDTTLCREFDTSDLIRVITTYWISRLYLCTCTPC